MKKIRARVRAFLAHAVLNLLTLATRFVQIGNPFNRAPTVQEAPREDESLGVFDGGRVYRFDDAIASGRRGGLLISNRNEVFTNLGHHPLGLARHPEVVRLKVPRPRVLPGTCAYLCTPEATGNYYHWMIDLVPRLALLEQAGYTAKNLDHVLINGDSAWGLEPLLAYGFQRHQIQSCGANERWQAPHMVTTSLVANYEAFDAWKAHFLRRLFPSETAKPNQLLFCGRQDAQWRRLLNEDELFDRLEPLGFYRLNASALSVASSALAIGRAKNASSAGL